MHNVYIPVIAIVAAFAIIFGGQAISESHLDEDVAVLIAKQVGSDVEVTDLREVQKGYGLCGEYQLDGQEASAPFYYSKSNDRVTLDPKASRFQRHCGE